MKEPSITNDKLTHKVLLWNVTFGYIFTYSYEGKR
jgi:hypothetical protein